MNKLSIALAATVIAMGASYTLPTNAASVTVYDDKTTFLNETGAVGTSPFPNLGGTLSSFSHENLTFTPTGLRTLNLHRNWTNHLPGIDLAVNGIEHLNVDTLKPVSSFGFDFVESQFERIPGYDVLAVNAPFFESTFQVTLVNSGTVIDSFEFSKPNDITTFVGVKSDQLFNRVEILETVGAADNEFYGTFYTSQAEPVPEPLTILGSATALGVGVLLKREFSKKKDKHQS
jgi:hypothetical protein